MSQGPLCPNLTQKVQKEVSQIVNRNFSPVILLGGLSVNLNHLKSVIHFNTMIELLFELGVLNSIGVVYVQTKSNQFI